MAKVTQQQIEAVRLVRQLHGYATPATLAEMGVRRSVLESAVRNGLLRWTRAGSVELSDVRPITADNFRVRGSVLALASVLANGEGPDRLTVRLVADRDRYRWYGVDGVSCEVGGVTVEAAIDAACERWPARDGWGFRIDE